MRANPFESVLRSMRPFVVVSAIAVFGLLGTGVALAVPFFFDSVPFELDGNALRDDTTKEDWNSYFGTTPITTGSHVASAQIFVDGTVGTPLAFSGSKDTLDTTAWAWAQKGSHTKGDLQHAYALGYSGSCPGGTPSSCEYIAFGADRLGTNGDAQMGFWFLHNKVLPVGTGISGTFSGGGHSLNDALVLVNFVKGGTQTNVQVYKWTASGPVLISDATTASDCAVAGATTLACATTNTVQVASPWTYQSSDNGVAANTFPVGGFFEGMINLTKLLNTAFAPCTSTFIAETRSSQSITANLTDFLSGSFESCKATVATTPVKADGSSMTNATVPLGTSVKDVALIDRTPASAPPPTGTVTFSLYTNGTCTGTGTQVGNPVTISGGLATSDPTAALAVGSYGFVATYNGDGAFPAKAGDCEPFTVSQAQLSISTTIAGGSPQALGSTPHDNATVTGAVNGFTPTGAVTFTFGANCGSGSIATAGAPDGGFTASSVNSSPLGAGSYNFQASVAGDSNYLGATSTCEPLTVNQAQLALSTTIAGGTTFALGATPHDSATVTGGVSPFATPAVSFLFGTSCPGGSSIATAGSPDGGFTASSVNTSPLGAGSYKFQASVAGDSNYLGATSACEPLTVDKTQLAITTTIQGGTVLDNGHYALGSKPNDSATVTGGVTGFDIPAITFTFGACPAGASIANASATTSIAAGGANGLGAGSYNFQASVAGNDNYLTKTSDCEPLTVDKTQLAITTTIKNAAGNGNVGGNVHVPLGTTVYDTASVTGGVDGFALPAISFSMGSGLTCANGASVNNATASSSVTAGPLGAGDYSYSASVAGNANYLGAPADCEPLTVDKGTLQLTTDIKNDQGGASVTAIEVGGSVHDTAALSGANINFSTATNATITFTFAGNGTCTNGTAETAATVANNGASGASHGPLVVGNYSFLASYSGNANYNAILNGACVETLAVVDANISITPLTKINNVGDPHVFNVTASAIPSGTSPALNSIIVTIPGASIVANSCNPFTGTAGTNTWSCAVSISGAVPATTVFTAHAALSVTMGGVTVTRATGDAKTGDSANANKEYDCLTHQFTMKLNNAGKSATSYANLNGGTWSVSFRYRYSADNGTTWSSWYFITGTLLNQNAPEVDGTGSLNYAATVTVPQSGTLSAPYTALVQWNPGVYSGGGTSANPDVLPYPVSPPPGSVTLANSGDCSGSDFRASPVSDVTVFKGIGATSVFDFPGNGLSGWTITATSGNTSVVLTTGADGSAQTSLDNLSVWTICETQQNGWTQSFPPANDVSNKTNANRCYVRPTNPSADEAGNLGAGGYVFGNKKQLAISTDIKDSGGNSVGGTTHVALGSVVHDTASVTGQFGNFAPSGTISFQFFTNLTCTSGAPVTATPDSATAAHTADSAPLTVGTGYSYQATIADDANYVGATSPCEPLTVNRAQLAISTVVYNGQVALANPGALAAGATPIVNDTATATGQIGAIAPTGAITFQFFNNGTCASTPAATPAATQTGLTASSANSASLAAGTYSYLAAIAGDTNYVGATAACESFTLTTLTITKQVIPTGGPTFTFAVTGASTLSVNVATAGTPGTGSTTVVINAGSSAVTEGAVQSYLLTAFNCGGLPVIGTVNFSATAGTNTNCYAENTKVQVATRTRASGRRTRPSPTPTGPRWSRLARRTSRPGARRRAPTPPSAATSCRRRRSEPMR